MGRFFRRLLFRQPCLFFFFGFCVHIIRTKLHEIFRNPSVAFFYRNFNEPIGFIGNRQFLPHGNQAQDRRICGGVLTDP